MAGSGTPRSLIAGILIEGILIEGGSTRPS